MSFPAWADEVRRHDKDRFTCAMFAPEPARTHLLALYAFNLELSKAREVVSEPLLGRIRLQWWRDTLDGLKSGKEPEGDVAKAFAQTIDQCGLARSAIDRLIDAREFDMEGVPPEDMAALVAYCEGTSSQLAQLALKIFAVEDPAAATAARHMGIAWALIGLARAVPFHARQGRVLLPRNLLKTAGIAPEQIRKGEALSSVVAQVADEGLEHLSRARELAREVDKKALPVLLPTTLADVYLKALKKCSYDPFDPLMLTVHTKGRFRLMLNAWRGRY